MNSYEFQKRLQEWDEGVSYEAKVLKHLNRNKPEPTQAEVNEELGEAPL